MLMQISWECTPPYLFTGISNLLSQPSEKCVGPALYVFSLFGFYTTDRKLYVSPYGGGGRLFLPGMIWLHVQYISYLV
jgi:hypothetical protein